MDENKTFDEKDLVHVGRECVENITSYYDDRIALVDNVKEMKSGGYIFDSYVCILCTAGKASVNINNVSYHIETDDFTVCRPNMMIDNGMYSADFEFRGIVLSVDFVKEFELRFNDGWDLLLSVDANPVNRFTSKECEVFNNYWELLLSKLSGEHGKYHNKVMEAILTAFFYELRDSIDHFTQPARLQYNSSEKLYKKFMELLTTQFPKQREVKYYADQLCVTPKYLSAVCKQTSGETASEIIYKYVINDVKFLLRRHDMSIKEVAFKLGFDNLSFFGKYTKRALGMSPKAFRLRGNT